MDEFISLREKKFAYVEEFLTNRGWVVLSIKEPKDEVYGSMTQHKFGQIQFAYNYDFENETAPCFLTFYFLKDDVNYNQIELQIFPNKYYLKFLSRLKELKYKLISSEIKDGSISKKYESPNDKTFFVKIKIKKELDEFNSTKTRYYIRINRSFNDYWYND